MGKEGNLSKVVAWLAGIAGTVIASWTIWYFTQPKPPAVVTTFEGMVYSGDAPVAKAMVAVDLTGNAGANGAIHDITNDNGAYKIELTGLPKGTGATLSVVAKGYENVPPRVLTQPLTQDERVDIPLTPVPVLGIAPVPPVPAAPGSTENPAVKHIPPYVPKSAAMARKFKFTARKQP